MIPHPKKWFRKSKKAAVEPSNSKATDSPDAAMSELAESLQKEIQGLAVEIRKLRTEREGLFRDIHHIMLSKSQASLLGESPLPAIDSPRPPSMHHKRSTQSLWLPLLSVPSIPEDNTAPKVEIGLFGPRSRTPSINGAPPTQNKSESEPSTPTIGSAPTVRMGSSPGGRRRTIRSMSEGSPSPSNLEVPSTPTRTAWRVVERKPESVYLARAASAAS